MHLFLGSQGLGAFPAWLGELPHFPRRAVLVPTASNPMPAKPWVAVAESALTTAGLTVDRLDLAESSPAGTAARMAGADLVFVTGGYPIYLLEHAQRTGFLTVVREAVKADRLAYAGISSGAILTCPDLDFYRGADDPGHVTDTTGLGLVPFYPLSHANRGREQLYAQLLADPGPREFVPMRDDEAIVVTGTTRTRRPS